MVSLFMELFAGIHGIKRLIEIKSDLKFPAESAKTAMFLVVNKTIHGPVTSICDFLPNFH